MKAGRITKLNSKQNRELKKLFLAKDIRYCEARLIEDCSPMTITFAHRHKKHWYLDKPDELRWSYNQVIGACLNCHNVLEVDSELTEKVFGRLRGKDDC